MSSSQITLFDIPTKTLSCWSPNTWKSRLSLSFKGVPFTTQWISYPDITPTFSHLITSDKPVVTLPMIKLPNGVLVADSWDIAVYLETTYNTKPSLFHGNKASHFFFQQYVSNILLGPLRVLALPKVPLILDERSAEYFNRTREAKFGASLEVWRKQNPQPHLDELKNKLIPVHLTLTETKKYLGGDEISYSDIVLLSIFLWLKVADEELLQKIFGLFEGGIEKEWYHRCVEVLKVDETLATK